jgi:hypothetical protein
MFIIIEIRILQENDSAHECNFSMAAGSPCASYFQVSMPALRANLQTPPETAQCSG